jgi:hypothetical protein
VDNFAADRQGEEVRAVGKRTLFKLQAFTVAIFPPFQKTPQAKIRICFYRPIFFHSSRELLFP